MVNELPQVDMLEERLSEIEKSFFFQGSIHDYFLNGNTGLALYYFYRGRASGQEHYTEKANDLINDILDQLGSPKKFYGGSFTLGITGLTSALTIMREEEFIDFEDADLAGLDAFIFNWAKQELDIMNTDYLHGAAGALNYFIERAGLGNKDCKSKAEELIEIFYSLAIKDQNGIRFLNKFYKNRFPEHINLGLSHGLTGVLLILQNAFEKGIAADLCLEMIAGGLKYMEREYFQKTFLQSGQSRFFVSIHEQSGELQYSDRLAWCYGDLNVALLFIKSGKMLDSQKYIDLGLEVGLETLSRTSEDQTEIRTPFFCHGSCGTALVYQTLFQLTGEHKFHQAYDLWRSRTMAMLDIEQLKMMSTGPLSFLDGPMGMVYFILGEQLGYKLKWEKYFLL